MPLSISTAANFWQPEAQKCLTVLPAMGGRVLRQGHVFEPLGVPKGECLAGVGFPPPAPEVCRSDSRPEAPCPLRATSTPMGG
jgi:hypothetical protein